MDESRAPLYPHAMYLAIVIYLLIGAWFAWLCWREPDGEVEFHPAYAFATAVFWLPFVVGVAIEAAIGFKTKLPKPTRPKQLRLP